VTSFLNHKYVYPDENMNKTNSHKIMIGLPLMHLEYGEKRSFLPDFVHTLEKCGADVYLEHGYGTGMELEDSAYSVAAPSVTFVSNREAYQQDIVLVLRCPSDDNLRNLRPESCLISMLHYSTQPERVRFLQSLGVNSISLDSIKNDSGQRLIENFHAVAWNGLEAAFQVLQDTYPGPGFFSPDRQAIQITLLGAGALGAHTVKAAVHYGSIPLHERLARENVPGVIVTAVDYDITNHAKIMRELLSRTDILVDASARVDTTRAIIPNEWLAYLPDHTVILDLCVDPYQQNKDNNYTKGIEGIPQGNLDQYIFAPDDPIYENIPDFVRTKHRRDVVSCYSWPGIHPRECMQVYGQQLHPIMRILLSRGGLCGINPNGRFFERAIGRALLSNWVR
jgi:alanine dehydrogenase